MADNTDLWAAVVADYDNDGLITLTNIRDRSVNAIDTAVGEAAAQAVINLWPAFAQVDYDAADALHVEAAELWVIAMLWRRGGSASSIAKVEWDEAITTVEKVKTTDPRSHRVGKSNSGTATSSERTSDGERTYGWSDPASLPGGRRYGPRVVPRED